MISIDRERRESPRIRVTRPCKLFDPRSRKYIAGSTCDVSAGGMLLRVSRPLDLDPGDRLFVAVAQKRRQALLRSSDLIQLEVVRTVPLSTNETAIGVRFRHPQQVSMSPPRKAA
jgi:hypothetical protein